MLGILEAGLYLWGGLLSNLAERHPFREVVRLLLGCFCPCRLAMDAKKVGAFGWLKHSVLGIFIFFAFVVMVVVNGDARNQTPGPQGRLTVLECLDTSPELTNAKLHSDLFHWNFAVFKTIFLVWRFWFCVNIVWCKCRTSLHLLSNCIFLYKNIPFLYHDDFYCQGLRIHIIQTLLFSLFCHF